MSKSRKNKKKEPDSPHFMVARELLSTIEYIEDKEGAGGCGFQPIESIRYQDDQETRRMDRFTVVVGTGPTAFRVLVTCIMLPERGMPPEMEEDEWDEDEPIEIVGVMTAKDAINKLMAKHDSENAEDGIPLDESTLQLALRAEAERQRVLGMAKGLTIKIAPAVTPPADDVRP